MAQAAPSVVSPSAPAVDAGPDTEPRHPRGLVAVLAFCGVVVAVMQTLIVPLLPHVPGLTGSTPTTASWLVTVTLLTGAVFTPLLGRVGDMYGKRRVLLGALGVLVAGSVLCAVSSVIGVLIAGRALQGAALAVVPLGISIMRDELAPERITPSVALMSSTLGIGATIGLPAAALVVEYSDWHTMFWVSAGIGVLDVLLVLRFVPESPLRSRGRFDALGALGLSVTLVALLLAVTKGGEWGWGSPRTLGLLCLAAIVGLAWGAWELRASSPMVDLRVSARRPVLLTNIGAMFIGFAFYANSLSTAQMVQEPTSTGYGLGASIVVSGLCLVPGGLSMVILSPVSARIVDRRGPKTALTIASAILATGYLVRCLTSHSLWLIVAGATVVAAGTAIAYSALPAMIMRSVPVSETAAANGLNTLMRSIGQACCSAVVAVVLASLTATTMGHTAPTLFAYQLVFVIAAAAATAGFVVTMCLPSRPRTVRGTVTRSTDDLSPAGESA